ncbi:MAG: DUF523 and DUF1722 domain-containing protein [Gammaproteobacteria bacterium]|nr:DUF523 and DUF1722 domain-containing protein [Gammaproteobacteria bacterium]
MNDFDQQSQQRSGGLIRLGVSGCLLGEKVRYDGGHKRNSYLTDTLAEWFELVPVCPEVGIGMSIPRPPIHLVKTGGGVRALGVDDPALDVTDALEGYYQQISPQISRISGYILKSGSPSCGLVRVKLHDSSGRVLPGRSIGRFAAGLLAARPLLPVVDEMQLNNGAQRENFITRVRVHHRWQVLMDGSPTATDLARFHADHSGLILAHNQASHRRLGRLVAAAESGELSVTLARYGSELMAGLSRRATRKSHARAQTQACRSSRSS